MLVPPDVVRSAAADAYLRRGQQDRWRTDPVAWATGQGVELWSGQRELLTGVAAHDRVAVRSCHSSGKTFAVSVLIGWWLSAHPVGTARVVTTAPHEDQVRGLLWVEVNRLWERLGLEGRINQTEIWYGSYQAAIGRKSSDYHPASFSGWHAPHLLVIADEADGVSKALWEAIDTLATSSGSKIVGIGNPDDPQSEFRRRQADQPFGGRYHTVKIPAWSTPNFTGETVSPFLASVLLSPAWVEEKRIAWGGDPTTDEPPDHPFWASKVEAEYPEESGRSVVRLPDLLRARQFERTGKLARADDLHPVRLGIDVAGSETGDESVIRAGRGKRVMGTWRTRTADPEELEDWLVDHVDLTGATQVAIDADGVGFGFAGALRRRRGTRVAVTAIRSGASATDPKAYGNRRAEMWWQLREALMRQGDEQLDLTALDDQTAAELLVPRYSTPKGRVLVESKDELRKRLGRSPDNADALVYLNARGAGGLVTVRRPTGPLTGRR